MRVRILILMLIAFAVGFVASHALHVAGARDEPPAPPASVGVADAPLPDDITAQEKRVIEVFRQAAGSVVNITTISLRRDFFSMNVYQIPSGTGSGFVWDREGHVVTNYHVIEDSSQFLMTLADHSEWEAKLVGVAPEKDLAVLRIDAEAARLAPLPLGRSRGLQVGQTVLAVGNPFGLDQTLTVGVVSALGRELEAPNGREIRDVIQSDAAINPGNSGGPLLDTGGRLIGVNSAIISPSGGSAGIGFAVPVDTVRRLVPQLIAYGKPIQPGIGVTLLSDYHADRLELEGVILHRVLEGPAREAGLEGLRASRRRRILPGDQIVAVNGDPVEDNEDLLYAFEELGVGATVELAVLRDGKRRTVRLELVALD